jgi:hypothetical protein
MSCLFWFVVRGGLRQLAVAIANLLSLLGRATRVSALWSRHPHQRHGRAYDLVEQHVAAGLGDREVKGDVLFRKAVLLDVLAG